jgi:hypothetical protein
MRLVFKAAIIQAEVFWVITPCKVVAGYQRFRGPASAEDGGSMNL